MIGPIEWPFILMPLGILVIWSAYRLVIKKGFDARSWRVPFFIIYLFVAFWLQRYGFTVGPDGTHPNGGYASAAGAISLIGALVLLAT